MKNVIILVGMFLFTVSAISGQTERTAMNKRNEPKKEIDATVVPLTKLEGTVVPETVKAKFYADFSYMPDATWERETFYDVATFTRNGKQVRAYYDYEGNLVGTTEPMVFADLPQNVQKKIESKYKGYSIGPVIFFDDNEGTATDMSLWDTQFYDADNYFIEMTKADSRIVVRVDTQGELFLFKKLK